MTAGLFKSSGHFHGKDLLSPTISNPTGYFESSLINQLNNRIISDSLRWKRLNRIRRLFLPRALWDSSVFPITFIESERIHVTEESDKAIRVLASKRPFCYKDPRFCSTYPAWRPHLPKETLIIVVFRNPKQVADSYLRNLEEIYPKHIRVSREWIFHSFSENYRKIIQLILNSPFQTIFLQYSQVANESRIEEIEELVGTKLSRGHVNPDVSRTQITDEDLEGVPRSCTEIYQGLKQLAPQ